MKCIIHTIILLLIFFALHVSLIKSEKSYEASCHTFKYRDKVRVISGFFIGHTGTVLGKSITECNYIIQLGGEHSLDIQNVEAKDLEIF